jgi:Asp-tRNA(Asn)/Glu-tRNA(Gln) amidotransferase A subunit family amidase
VKTTANIFLDKSISEIHEGFLSKNIDPIDVAHVCIRQYEALESKYHAWVCFDKESLLDQANASKDNIDAGKDIRSLEGIPIGVKDIFNTMEFSTQMGSPIWKGFTPGNDARVVYQVKKAGGVIPGKTVTAEFAVHTLDKTMNPHDVSRTPGTSSSGSAVAIALGMVPVALGTQTAGSIVRPASFCGVYGCKPSFGLIPRTGTLKTTDSLDTIGFFVARCDDLLRVFDSIRVYGPNYPFSYEALRDLSRQNKPEGRPWRIALARTHTWQYAFDYAKSALLQWAKKLSEDKSIEIIEADLPEITINAHTTHSVIYDKTLSYYFKEEYKKSELVSPIMNEIIRRGNEISIQEYHDALKEQERLCHAMDRYMQGFDAMISLSTAGEAPLRAITENQDPALLWTMSHLPIVSAPAFISPNGLPFGVQVVARRYNDYLLFKFIAHLRSLELLPPSPNPMYNFAD